MSVSGRAESRGRVERAEHALYFVLVAAGSGAILWFVFAILALTRSVLGGSSWLDT